LWCRHADKKSPALVSRTFLKGHADECEGEPKIVAYEGGALFGYSAPLGIGDVLVDERNHQLLFRAEMIVDQLRKCLDLGH
jgi:hypothetical protein